MASDRATLDTYAGVEVELPNGRTIKRDALPLKRGMHWLRVLMRAEAGDSEAQLELMDGFAEEVGISPDERIMPFEVFEVARRFLSQRRTPETGTTTSPTRGTPPPPGLTTGGTT